MLLYEHEYELGLGLLLSAPADHEDDWAAMIPRAGTPLLVGPDSTEADVEASADADASPPASPSPEDKPVPSAAPSSAKEPERSKTPDSNTSSAIAEKTTQSSSADQASTATAPASSTTDTASTPSTSAPSTSTAQQTGTVDGLKPIQLNSLAYLVPIFLLVAVTIGVIIYRKCHARRRIDREASSRFQSPAHVAPPGAHGWKQVDGSDDEDDDEKAGHDDENEGDLGLPQMPAQWQMKESKSRPGLMDVSYGTGSGWLKGPKWKSARTLNDCQDSPTAASASAQQGKTMKLVAPALGPSTTYQSLASKDQSATAEPGHTHGSEERGSRRGWKDSLRSLAHQLTPTRKQLERNRSPNKRRTQHPVITVAPPEAPDWIRPRAASPAPQVLSPPMQPHLFFHPPAVDSMPALQLPLTPNTDSECTYTDTDSRPASSMYRQSHIPLRPGTGAKIPTTSTPRKRLANEDPDRTPTRASYIAKAASQYPTPTRASSTARRQQGISRASEWAATSPKPKSTLASSARTTVRSNGQPSSSTVTPRQSRKERREAKTRERVESILQASWSDRALSSHSSPSSDSLVGGPIAFGSSVAGNARVAGSSSRAAAEASGIEARLAMFKPAK